MAGILSKGITLSYKASSSSSYTALTNLQSIPSLGGTPERVDITTLADDARHYIKGVKDYGELAFGFLYDKTQYNTLDGLGDTVVSWKVELADGTTSGSTFEFDAQAMVSLDAKGVNEALTYTLNLLLNSDIDFTPAT